MREFAQPSRQPAPNARRPWSALHLRGAVGNRAMGRLLARRPRSLPTDPTQLEDYRPALTQLKVDTDIQSLGAVGNRAMGRLLARRPRSLPTDPTQLEDYRPVLTQLKIDTDIQTLGALNRFFRETGGRFATRDGFSVNFNRSPDLDALAAKVPVVGIGLDNLALFIFNLTNVATEPVITDAVHVQHLQLDAFKGWDGDYRFTSVRVTSGEVDVMVEYLGHSLDTPPDWEVALIKRTFDDFGFTWGTGDVGWATDRKTEVMSDIDEVPRAVLHEVRGIDWQRMRAPNGPDGEAGEYQGRAIKLYTNAFSDARHLRELVVHEIGHALDFRPQERGGPSPRNADPAYRTAAGALSTAVTDYGKGAWKENFAEDFAMFVVDPDLLKLLRPNVHEYFDKLVDGLPKAP